MAGSLDRSCVAGSLEMKLHLSVRSSHSLILLGTIFIGWSTGVLWPVNGFLLNYLVGFVVTLCAILIVASVVWCASTFYILACRPFVKLLKFKKKLTFARPVVPDDVTPIVTASAALDGTTAGKWYRRSRAHGCRRPMVTFVGMGNMYRRKSVRCVCLLERCRLLCRWFWIVCCCGGVR